MRRLAAALALAVLVAVVFLARHSAPDPSGEAARNSASVKELENSSERARDTPTETSREIEVGTPATERRLAVLGRLVDPDGKAVAGARISAAAVETQSDVEGSFELEIPVLAPDLETPLEIAADGRELVQRRVSASAAVRRDGRDAIDFGSIVLHVGGEVRGTVVDSRGRPLSLAPVSLDGDSVFRLQTQGARGSDALPREIVGRADRDGRFRFEHVGSGTHSLYVADRTFGRRSAVDFQLELGVALDLGTIEIDCVGFVAGRVQRSDGRPIFGAQISEGRRSRAPVLRMPSSTHSDSEGSFWLPLQVSPAELRIACEGYYAHDDAELGIQRPPGSLDVLVVLERMPTARFLVLDAATEQPVETFALWLESASKEGIHHRVDEHPGGTIELPRSPDDDNFAIVAPGYASQLGALSPPSDQPQVIRLLRGGSIVGRILADNLRGGRVSIERARQDDKRFDLGPLEGRSRTTSCDSQGAFAVSELAAGTYRLEARAQDGSQAVVERVYVPPETSVNLGELRLIGGASLKGRLLLPEHDAVALVYLTAAAGGRQKTETIRGDGEFDIHALPSGRWVLSISSSPEIVVGGCVAELDLAPGETREIELDLRVRPECPLSVSVRADGAGVAAWVVVSDGRGQRAKLETDEEGHGTTRVGIYGKATILVTTLRGLPLAQREVHFTSSPMQADFEASTGSLALSLAPPEAEIERAVLVVRGPNGGERGRASMEPDELTPRVDLGQIAVGNYELELFYLIPEVASRRLPSWSTTVEIKPGETTVADLREAKDR